MVLAWALYASALACAWPEAAPGPVTVLSGADLARLPAEGDAAALQAALEDVRLRDAENERFTAFQSDLDHRFRLTARLRGRTPPVRVDTEAWTQAGRLGFALSPGQIDAALKAVELDASAAQLARMGLTVQAWTVRPSGYADTVDVELTVELALAGVKFRTGATYRVAGNVVHVGQVRPSDLMRFAAAASRDPFFRLLEPRARRVDGALAVGLAHGRLEMPLTWDVSLTGGGKLEIGGTFRLDLATGRGGFVELSLPLPDLPKCGIKELEALARRGDVKWFLANPEPGGDVHITIRPAGWIVRLSSGTGWRLDLAVDESVTVLVASLPAEALTDPAARADAELRGFLIQAGQLADTAALLPLQRAYPDVLVLQVTAARVALQRGAKAEATRLAGTAADTCAAMVAAWDRARAAAARGALAEAAAAARDALRRCPTDARLWLAHRRLILSAQPEAPPLPPELAQWRQAPFDAPRLFASVRDLQKSLGLAPLPGGLPAPTPDAPAPGIAGWKPASTGDEPPAWPGGPSRRVVRYEPAAPLRGLAKLELFPPTVVAPTPAMLTEALARIERLRIGKTPLFASPRVELWLESFDRDALLPPLEDPRYRSVPDGLLEQLGSLRRPLLERAYREPVALFTFAARGGIATGRVLGIDVPALDRQLLLDMTIPGGQIDAAGVRELMTPMFEAGGQPSLGKAEVHLTGEALEVSYLPKGQEDEQLLRSLRKKTAMLALGAGRMRLDRCGVIAIDGALRVAPGF